MYGCDEGVDFYWTNFYEGTEIKTHKKYWLFGETITKVIPKLVFKLYFNVEDVDRTKRELSAILHRRLELLERANEIAKGELI
jgi:hypothetical protein